MAKPKREPNVFIARARAVEQAEFEQMARDMLARENLPVVDPDFFKLHSSKPSPAGALSASRADSMAARARYRKTQDFIARKEQQRRDRKESP